MWSWGFSVRVMSPHPAKLGRPVLGYYDDTLFDRSALGISCVRHHEEPLAVRSQVINTLLGAHGSEGEERSRRRERRQGTHTHLHLHHLVVSSANALSEIEPIASSIPSRRDGAGRGNQPASCGGRETCSEYLRLIGLHPRAGGEAAVGRDSGDI